MARSALPRRSRLRAGQRLLAGLTALVAVAGGTVVAVTALAAPAGAVAAGSPVGQVEHIFYVAGQVQWYGWAYDPGTTHAISVYVTDNGKKTATFTADTSRPDIAKKYHVGAAHGFTHRVTTARGQHTLCAYAVNVGKGANSKLGCWVRNVDYGPVGHLDNLQAAPGSIYVRGWAYDRDNPKAPVTVTVTVDRTTTRVRANAARADFGKIYHLEGPDHGFSIKLPAAQGSHEVCVRGINIGHGQNNTFACKKITLAESPVLNVGTLERRKNTVYLRAWAYDPDAPRTALTAYVTADGVRHTLRANQVRASLASSHPGAGTRHGFGAAYALGQGSHRICVTAKNISYGHDTAATCRTVTLNFVPAVALDPVVKTSTGITLTGWATDPDTSRSIPVRVSAGGATHTVTANRSGASHSGHRFSLTVPMRSGTSKVCATGVNVGYGTANSKAACRTIALTYSPIGGFSTLKRGSASALVATGWALDPDSTAAVSVSATLDGKTVRTVAADLARADVAKAYPGEGTHRGFSFTVAATAGEHRLCLTARNIGPGANRSLGCKMINAVHPVAPSAPRSVRAVAGYGGATLSWAAPAADGGAPWSKYTITTSPGGRSVSVSATTATTTITGLSARTGYTFSVRAVNVAGSSAAGTSAKVTTQAGPPAQRSPAPVSTSRYIRNVHGSGASDLAAMRKEGAADAAANPSGHGYLVLLDIGGQDQSDGGVVLSAGVRFVTYAALVKDVEAYTAGYHSKQKASAPVVIAIGTNNDMDVSTSSGRTWADRVVDPVVAYAAHYTGMTIAGANDIEPGFRASYGATRDWLSGFLGATRAPFIFNGSADGCAWTATGRACNNGWSMSGLYNLAAGAAPTRILNLPQIYNTTMPAQWKYISLTGVAAHHPRINFAGALTEWTACQQAGGCGSITGHSAWSALWRDLQSDPRLKVSSLPYSTDLRIDRG